MCIFSACFAFANMHGFMTFDKHHNLSFRIIDVKPLSKEILNFDTGSGREMLQDTGIRIYYCRLFCHLYFGNVKKKEGSNLHV